MTDLINQININGETTTFLNYVNPSIGAEPVLFDSSGWLTDSLIQQYGDIRTAWTQSLTPGVYNIRFPVPWETITGDILNTARLGLASDRRRVQVGIARYGQYINSSTTNTSTFPQLGSLSFIAAPANASHTFVVLNDYSVVICSFSSTARTSAYTLFQYLGWAKSGQYTGPGYPRNFVTLTSLVQNGNLTYFHAERVKQENTTTKEVLLGTQPSLLCQVATTGADSTDAIIRDSTAPNNYIGKLWNMMILPSTAVVGKIYKNTGIDPDTGVVETDQKAFWMCVGDWGTDKIGMRVWTENIT